MRRIGLGVFVTIVSTVSGFVLYGLAAEAADQFLETYRSFNVSPPAASAWFLSNINLWPYFLVFIIFAGYLPLFLTGKKQYFSICTSLSCLLIVVVLVYAPIIKMGAVI